MEVTGREKPCAAQWQDLPKRIFGGRGISIVWQLEENSSGKDGNFQSNQPPSLCVLGEGELAAGH